MWCSIEVIRNLLPASRGYNAIGQHGAIGERRNDAADCLDSGRCASSTATAVAGTKGRVQVDGLTHWGAVQRRTAYPGYIMDVQFAGGAVHARRADWARPKWVGRTSMSSRKPAATSSPGRSSAATPAAGLRAAISSDRLSALGLTQSQGLQQLGPTGGSLGGPILKDRVWFFTTVRSFGTMESIPGMFANLERWRPRPRWTYEKNADIESRNAIGRKIIAARFTAQVTPRNKISILHRQSVLV